MEKLNWIEIQNLVGKPVWQKGIKKWRILEGYREMSKKMITFTDSNSWYEFDELELYKEEIVE